MAHFYGTLQGARGKGTRTGNKSSGMVTECASWTGAVRCRAFYNEELKEDWSNFHFSLLTHSLTYKDWDHSSTQAKGPRD